MDINSEGTVLVDVVIAVHTPDRPVERAISSLMDAGLPTRTGDNNRLRVTVVCHNTDVGPIKSRVDPEHRQKVRFVQLMDGILSPAGPFNYGISLASGEWVSIMGSDDSVEKGAFSRWVEAASNDRADVLIAPMAHSDGRAIRTPVVRRNRKLELDPVADRLMYRTAPLGLMRLSLVRSLGLIFPAKYPTGEDQEFSAQLWFAGVRVMYGRGMPRYLVHDDATLRVTATPRKVVEDLEFATDLVKTEWFSQLGSIEKAAVVTKLLRIHVFGHVMLRAEAGTWNSEDAESMALVAQTLIFSAPEAVRPLSLADRALIDAVVRKESGLEAMKSLSLARRTFTNPRTWVPRDFSQFMHPEAPFRFMSASAMMS